MNNNITIDIEDYKAIFSHQGRIDGLVSNYNLNNPLSAMSDSFKESLQNAKGVLIEVSMNTSVSILDLSDLMEKTNALIRDNCDVVFGTKINESLDLETVNITIIATGLDINNQIV